MSDPKQADIETAPEAPQSPADLTATGAEPTGYPPGVDAQVAELEIQLVEANEKVAAQLDAFMRAKAETENVRRRAVEDVSKAHRFGVERMAEALVAVKDSLDAALAVENASVEAYRTGVEITGKQLSGVFEKFHIVEVNPIGEKFDPNKHQAIATVESDQEANTVVTVMQKGFLLHDRVLRPALVTVAKGAAS